jgi:hypothetical protein
LGNRKLNWNFVDWQWWVIGMVGTGIITLVVTFSLSITSEMIVTSMIVGGVILIIYRIIKKIKNKIKTK